jgi:hypothetical protein
VLDDLRGEDSIAELCRREGIALQSTPEWWRDIIPPDRFAALNPF